MWDNIIRPLSSLLSGNQKEPLKYFRRTYCPLILKQAPNCNMDDMERLRALPVYQLQPKAQNFVFVTLVKLNRDKVQPGK